MNEHDRHAADLDSRRSRDKALLIAAAVGGTGRKRHPRVYEVKAKNGTRWLKISSHRTMRAARRTARNLRNTHHPSRRFCFVARPYIGYAMNYRGRRYAVRRTRWDVVEDLDYRPPKEKNEIAVAFDDSRADNRSRPAATTTTTTKAPIVS